MIEEIIRSYRNLSDKVEECVYSVGDKIYNLLVPEINLRLCYARALENGGRGKHPPNGKKKGKKKPEKNKKRDLNWREHKPKRT